MNRVKTLNSYITTILLLSMNAIVYYTYIFIIGSNRLGVAFIGIIVLSMLTRCISKLVSSVMISQNTFNLYLLITTVMELMIYALNYYIVTRLVTFLDFSNESVKLLFISVVTISLNKVVYDFKNMMEGKW